MDKASRERRNNKRGWIIAIIIGITAIGHSEYSNGKQNQTIKQCQDMLYLEVFGKENPLDDDEKWSFTSKWF